MDLLPHVVVDHGHFDVAPSRTVLWLHGLGADGHDFEPIVPQLRLPATTDVRFIFPHAPSQPVTINGGLVMPAWYDIRSLDSDRNEDLDGVAKSARSIEHIIAAEYERGIASSRLVVAGFSQGGALALYTGLRHARPLAGLLILSAYLLDPGSLGDESIVRQPRETPILECHGRFDPVVPVALGEACARALETRGHAIEWRTYAVDHGVDGNEIRDIGSWLAHVLR